MSSWLIQEFLPKRFSRRKDFEKAFDGNCLWIESLIVHMETISPILVEKSRPSTPERIWSKSNEQKVIWAQLFSTNVMVISERICFVRREGKIDQHNYGDPLHELQQVCVVKFPMHGHTKSSHFFKLVYLLKPTEKSFTVSSTSTAISYHSNPHPINLLRRPWLPYKLQLPPTFFRR